MKRPASSRVSKVAFLANTSIVEQHGLAQSSYTFEKVGMTLAVRPSITPEKNVDMIVNILMSQLTGDLVNAQPVRTQMETKTNMIVHDSETLMLGGILFQEKKQDQAQVAPAGRSSVDRLAVPAQQRAKVSNNEMIVFITPFVISGAEMSDEAKATLLKSKERLDQIAAGVERRRG